MKIRVCRAGLMLDDKLVPLVSGALHYWRIGRERWEEILDLVAQLGFRVVETYIPWSVHELERGRFDFGESDRRRALPEFIAAVEKRGMYLLVRPGPHINAELTCFGYPQRVLRDRRCLSVSVDGDPVWLPIPPKMWPAPSYASEAFYEEVGLWFDALAPILKPRLAPAGGCILALQLDNEFSNLFRTSPYDHDYHPDALALWRKFYQARHGAEAPVPEAPRAFRARSAEDLPLYLDWVEFKEYYMQNALARLRRMWEDRGIAGIPFFHNYPAGYDFPPNNYTEVEKIVDFQGPDIYPTRGQYSELKSLVCFAAGLSRLPFIPEFSSGSFFWSAPVSVEDQAFTTPACFMHGIKAINFYMIVERERWYGSPITRDARRRPAAWNLYLDFHRWFKRTRINELRKQSTALLLSVRDYDRLALASTLLDPLPPLTPGLVKAEFHASADTFGFAEPIPLAAERQWFALFHGLAAAQIPFDAGNTAQPAEAWSSYQAVLCPTFEFLDAGVQEKLLLYARQGGNLILGPRLPHLDSRMKPCTLLKDALHSPGEPLAGGQILSWTAGAGRIALLPGLPPASARHRPESTTRLLLALAEAFHLARPYPAEDAVIETVLHKDERGAVLLVANPSPERRTAVISPQNSESLVDVQTGEKFTGAPLSIPLSPYTIRILEIV